MMATAYVNERLDHLGIVAGVCREIGVAAWLDQQDTQYHERVGVGIATVAMILNGLGFSNRRLYLTPQFFANTPIESLLGPGITAADLNDDCLGRTLDWLYAHDPTALFAGLAAQARRVFGIKVERLHADTTTFSVSGDYVPDAGDLDAQAIAITYGYSRDHRDDLKQWAMALITAGEGDIPLFFRAVDGNSSDKATIVQAVSDLTAQLRAGGEEPGWAIADSALYSAANLGLLNTAQVRWMTRVPETLREAKDAVRRADAPWQTTDDGATWWWSQIVALPQGQERWVIVRTQEGEACARATFTRQATKIQSAWEKKVGHLAHERFACEADAQAASAHLLQEMPAWLQAHAQLIAHPTYAGRGRPKAGTPPSGSTWQIVITLHVDPARQEQEIQRRAAFIVASNVLDAEPLAILAVYREQGSVERGFRFLKDPLFLASSVFLQKPERIVALALVMTLCLLIYRLAEYQVRRQLAATGQTIPDQLGKLTARPTLRWIFQCFEGIDLLHIGAATTVVLRLTPLHEQILALLGPLYLQIYHLTN
jgi:transposase